MSGEWFWQWDYIENPPKNHIILPTKMEREILKKELTFAEVSKKFDKLSNGDKEFVNWLIEGVATKRFGFEDGIGKLMELYEQETEETIEGVKAYCTLHTTLP